MDLTNLVIFLAIAGWLAGARMKGGGFGLLGNIVAWAVGACLLAGTLAAEEDPLAVLDAPAVDAASDGGDDPLSVLDEPSGAAKDALGRDGVL